jgi:hypothetical protein
MSTVSRGLLMTEARGLSRAVGGKMSAELVAAKAFAKLHADVPGGYSWRETWDWARRLGRGDSDFRGRRVYSDAGRSDCRYVARIAHRAYSSLTLPDSPRAWGNLRESIARIYAELAGGVP